VATFFKNYIAKVNTSKDYSHSTISSSLLLLSAIVCASLTEFSGNGIPWLGWAGLLNEVKSETNIYTPYRPVFQHSYHFTPYYKIISETRYFRSKLSGYSPPQTSDILPATGPMPTRSDYSDFIDSKFLFDGTTSPTNLVMAHTIPFE
jgi:hypothetical protein